MKLVDLLVVLQRGNQKCWVLLYDRSHMGTLRCCVDDRITFDGLKEYLFRTVKSVKALSEGKVQIILEEEK